MTEDTYQNGSSLNRGDHRNALSFLVFVPDLIKLAAPSYLFWPSLFHKMDRGMHRAEQPDDCEDCQSQSELGSTITRELAKRFEPCLVLYRGRKSRCQAKPVKGGEHQHQAENHEFERQELSIFGEEQRAN